MIIGTLRIRLRIRAARSLKEKRFVLKSIKDRLRKKFNISLSEIGEKDLWQSADLAIAVVGDEQRYLNQVLDEVSRQFTSHSSMEVLDTAMEFF